jgi:membrane-bound lytic murein transglycosylase MltF
MWHRHVAFVLAAGLAAAGLCVPARGAAAAGSSSPAQDLRRLEIRNKPWTGDFDQMLARRIIRVDAPYSRTQYFVDGGRERGTEAELVREFERWVNRKYAKELGKRPLTVYIGAATRDRLFADVRDGRADIAVGNLTVTEERLKLVDFVAPDAKLANTEILVTGPASPAVATLDDLAGKTVELRQASSYYASVVALNERFARTGRAPIRIVLVPDALEDEDMLEMLNAGLLRALVVDEFKAKLWSQVLPRIKVHEDIVLRPPTKKGWAIRKASPGLRAVLEEFYAAQAGKTGAIPHRQLQYMKSIKALNDPTGSADAKRFEQTIALFEKYGAQYRFDALMLAAQGYQESTLDQSKRGPSGAIGVMQLMPATGNAMKVGDITVTDANIHAGAKYLDYLMAQYFRDAKFDAHNRSLFAFASYNAGPGNIVRVRDEARKRGLDPDRWFDNVEVVAAEKLGIETTTYVRNVFKYYVSYTLMRDARSAATAAKERVAPAKR